jgi:signal transduction histidine kinase
MRTLRVLRWISILAPLAFLAALGVLLELGLRPSLGDRAAFGVAFVVGAAGVAAFSFLVFWEFERLQGRLQQRTEELQALYEAGMSLNSRLELDAVLHRLVELATQLTAARYGALSILAPDGSIARFITVGVSDEERRRIGDPPRGRGLLGLMLREGATLRVADISRDPRHVGFPPHHPPMKSLLGVPVAIGGRVIGNLYLTDRQGGRPFDDRDEELVRLLAAEAAVAIENARLYEQVGALARLEERERIGMDLHDSIIQSVYAVSLQLEDIAERIEESREDVRPRLERSIESLNKVIRDIRSYIFDLRPQASQASDLRAALKELVDELRVNTLIEAELEVTEELPELTDEQALAIFHVVQEALNNAARHSRASTVRVTVAGRENDVRVEVADNGVGFDPATNRDRHKHGLRNMADRARSLGAHLQIDSSPGKGTRVRLDVPLAETRVR